MTIFNNVSDTRATVDPGFAYASFDAEMETVFAQIFAAANVISTTEPLPPSYSGNQAVVTWPDGTSITADIASMKRNAATVNHIAIDSGDAWAEAYGRLRIHADGAVSSAKATKLGFGNDQVAEVWTGNLQLDMNSGAVTGKIKTMTLAWSADDPLTPAFEWQYVMLKGSAGITASGALTGKVTGVEWGTATSPALHDVDLSYSATGSISGLKADANTLFNAIEANGFNALQSSLYAGKDVINGTSGNDYLDAATGNDKVFGNAGDDEIYGGLGNDQLFGGAGNDVIDGGAGKDSINSGDGNDTLGGGTGADKLSGGAGSDTFVFDNLAVGGFDTIMDFDGSDVIAFDAAVFTSLAGGITADNFVRGAAALDGNDYLIFNPAGGKLYYDADGNGADAAVQIVAVKGATADLAYSDFQIF